jgi:hypothetical protein
MNAHRSFILGTSIVALTLIGIAGCETQHSETTKSGPFSDKHTETTTTKNPVTGDVNTTTSEQKTTKNPITGDTSTKTETHTNP